MGSWGHGLLGSDLGSWGQTWEAVQEFPVEIHKSLPLNDLRISSLIKVVSLLARTYGKKRRILGQPPSHGTGKREDVPPMALAALAAGAHGLMIEVHPDPDHALSDGAQSLDFPGFERLLTKVRNLAEHL